MTLLCYTNIHLKIKIKIQYQYFHFSVLMNSKTCEIIKIIF